MYQPPMILLTPFNGDLLDLRNIIEKNIIELSLNDKWIVIFDNINFDLGALVSDNRITYLTYSGACGAGNARNFGLQYIKDNLDCPILLLPIDGDDELITGSLKMIRKLYKITENHRKIKQNQTKSWMNFTKS